MGWRLTWIAGGSVVAMTTAILAAFGTGDEGLRMALRATARTSLALFLLAITASSLHRLFKRKWTATLLKNRRFIGVAFALSHTVHLALIGWRARSQPGPFWSERTISSLIPGATAYFFIAVMALTSSRAARRRLGRLWAVIHKVGVYVIWAVFVGASVRGARAGGAHVLPLVLLGSALLMRATARADIWRARRRRD